MFQQKVPTSVFLIAGVKSIFIKYPRKEKDYFGMCLIHCAFATNFFSIKLKTYWKCGRTEHSKYFWGLCVWEKNARSVGMLMFLYYYFGSPSKKRRIIVLSILNLYCSHSTVFFFKVEMHILINFPLKMKQGGMAVKIFVNWKIEKKKPTPTKTYLLLLTLESSWILPSLLEMSA